MPLHVDFAARESYSEIIRGLRTERLRAGLTQGAVAEGLPFRRRAVSEWETGAVEPTLDHLLLLTDRLGRRLVIADPHGAVADAALRQRAGEEWLAYQRRRLATPLRIRRLVRGWTQIEVGRRVGVSRDSVQRWELVRMPPRPIVHVVWAQRLGCTLMLAPAT